MYNYMLDTFVAAADCGSFTKAAEKLFISPTAVMKQMNALEKHLDLKLIDRRSSGITLTSAGEVIYKSAKFIIDYSAKTIAQAAAAADEYNTTFCIGTSQLNPAKPFMDLWYKASGKFANYKLHLVPFEDNHEGILSEISKLGEKFDFLIGVCDSKAWLSRCNFLQIGYCKKMIAVFREHPLARKRKVNISDLYGQTLMMVKEGDSGVNDFIRHDLTLNHPQIKIEDTPNYYDLEVFNRAAQTDNVLLTLDCWADVHPALVTIPVNWDYAIPYGIMYALNPPDDVIEFIEEVSINAT